MTNPFPNPLFLIGDTVDRIDRLVSEGGYTPVECSVGGESIVDDLELDHHGEYSHLPGVAIAAYENFLGARAERPFFVTCAPVDADACFATAALMGLLPPPTEEENLKHLAWTINQIDVDPIGANPLELPHGDMVLAWNVIMSGNLNTPSAYAAGTYLWEQLVKAPTWRLAPLLSGVKAAEEARRDSAAKDLENCSPTRYGDPTVLCLFETEAWGFDVWYGRSVLTGSPEDLAGWEHPVVLALGKQSQEITVGCPSVEVAEAIFGPGGLKNVFAELQPEGWGGREAIGGSPRSKPMTKDALFTAGVKIASLIELRRQGA